MFRQIRTPDDFSEVVTLGDTTESLYLEFKRTAHNWDLPKKSSQTAEEVAERAEAQMIFVADLAQFANAEGGVVLYGVNEATGPTPNLKIAHSVASIGNPDGLKSWMEQAIRNYAAPATFTRDIVSINIHSGILLAVNVPQSRYLVSVWDRSKHTVKYPKRTSNGLDWLNPDEAERHIMNGSRAARLSVLKAKETALTADVIVAGGLRLRHSGSTGSEPWPHHQGIRFGQLGDDWFELLVSVGGPKKIPANIPYGLIEEAWVDSKNRTNLLLSVKVIVTSDHQVLLEP